MDINTDITNKSSANNDEEPNDAELNEFLQDLFKKDETFITALNDSYLKHQTYKHNIEDDTIDESRPLSPNKGFTEKIVSKVTKRYFRKDAADI